VTAKVEAHGGDGNDVLYLTGSGGSKGFGDAGNDRLYGGSGADELHGGDGFDKLYGQDGNDTIYGDADGDFAEGGAGDDKINGGDSGDELYGGEGADTFTSTAGNDTIYGGPGADTITVTRTTDTATLAVYGDDGADTLKLSVPSGSQAILLGNHEMFIGDFVLQFDDSTDTIQYTDSSPSTILVTSSATSMDFGTITLEVIGTAINVVNATPRIPGGNLQLKSATLTGTLNTELGGLSVNATSTSNAGNLIVREKDSLRLCVDGLQTANGLIDVQLSGPAAKLSLEAGKIWAGGTANPIGILADDIDFTAGEDSVSGTGTLTIRSKSEVRNYNVGSAGETASGGDLSNESADNGAMDLSMTDLAAIADSFTSFTLGHQYSGNLMNLGDAQDQTEVKYTKQARTVRASLRNDTNLFADRINVSGSFEVPDDVLRLQARLIDIASRNLHVPMGPPDAGLTATRIFIDVVEQIQVSGWIKATHLVQIQVTGTTGANAISTFDDGPNSINTDLTSVINTQAANSQISIQATGSARFAGPVEAAGDGSKITINSTVAVRTREGGSLSTPGNYSSIDVAAGTWVWVDSGSAVLAGVRFDTIDGVPVPVAIGTDAAITLSSSRELWLGGSVTSTGQITPTAGQKLFDHADYFDSLPGATLAETAPLASDISSLSAGQFPQALRSVLTASKLTLGSSVTVSSLQTGKRWLVSDTAGNSYVFLASDPENDGTLDKLLVLKPHYLIGQRGFGLLVTGTMTVMQDNYSLLLQATDDVIIRGNINIPGQNGNLTLQSDKRVFWEGEASVTNNIGLYGGVEIDGTDRSGSDSKGSSIYIDPTSRLVSSQSGSDIVLRGSRDVDILGAIVAGGTVGATGVTWAGPDSTVSIIAGQQIYVDTAVQAAATATLQAGTPGTDDNSTSIIITTAGGVNTGGLTSGTVGGHIAVTGGGDIQIMGNVTSGGTVTQQINADGQFVGESFTWSPKKSDIVVNAGGQAWIGGMAMNTQNQLVETGGFLRTTERIEIYGGMNSSGVGVRVAGAS
ncbi:MAG: hypothetical protein RLZZ536_3421, partial [Planctomycetota bacterium]